MIEETASLEAAEEAAGRVPARLRQLASVGADPAGGITRLPLSPAEAEAVDLIASWAREAGAEVVRDRFGSIFALLGDWTANPGLMLGSHLDTVPRGGAYDGALGVVAAISVLEAWSGPGALCVAAFRAEEATLSAFGRLGSSVYTGAVGYERAAALLGSDPSVDLCGLSRQSVAYPAAYLELHVEQGARLERAGQTIGAVTGIAGYVRVTATVEGRADHVGTTPMDDRRDALAAAAELILATERIAPMDVEVASVGALRHQPNTVGVVAGDAELTADLRSLDDDAVDRGLARLRHEAAAIGARRRVSIRTAVAARVPAVRFPAHVIEAIESSSGALGEDAMRLTSGANHDASNLAAVCPAGMIFVPSRDGRSHSAQEFTSPHACELGATVLALSAARLATDGGRADER